MKKNIDVRVDEDVNELKVAGRDIHEAQHPIVDCPHCLGTGTKHVKCTDCDGQGWYIHQQSGKRIDPCPLCNGKGRHNRRSVIPNSQVKLFIWRLPFLRIYNEETCPNCDGAGKISLSGEC